MVLNPAKLFLYALAFQFSSGRGRCFSPGLKGLFAWYASRLKHSVFDRSAMKWWRGQLESD